MNIKKKLKQENGITMVVLTLTVVIMLIITISFSVNINAYAQRKHKTEFETDTNKLKEEIDIYYSENKALPIANKFTKTEFFTVLEDAHQKNINDNENYYVIDIDQLNKIDLNYGKDFETITDKELDINDLNDIYIINEQSHTIYYPHGIKYKDLVYYTNLDSSYTQIEMVRTKVPVTFVANGGNGTMEQQLALNGRTTKLDKNKFEAPTGYMFDGWNTKSDGTGTSYNDEEEVTFDNDITLYAKWKFITYTITFNKNADDATGTMSNQVFTYGTGQTLRENDFSRTNHQFLGWNTDPNALTALYVDEQNVNNLTTINNQVINLYAIWQEI